MWNVDAVTAAILGLSVLFNTGVVTWKECSGESVAWDTLTWFAALVAMSGYLNKYGLISWYVDRLTSTFSAITSWVGVNLSSSKFELQKPSPISED